MRKIIDSDEWYSPYDLLKLVSEGLGTTTWFDPTSCYECVKTTDPEFTILWDDKFDALLSSYAPWNDKATYMNPPFSKECGGAGPFVERLADQPRTAPTMVLLNTALSTNWQYEAIKKWDYIGIINPRVKFEKVERDPVSGKLHRVTKFKKNKEVDGVIVEEIVNNAPRYDNILLAKNLVNFPIKSGPYRVTWLEIVK